MKHRMMILPLAACLIAGCGYQMTDTFPENIRSVSVPIFENLSGQREMEFAVTEALTKEIEHRTPYKVTGTGAADTILQGRVTSVQPRLISRTEIGGLPQEVEVQVLVDFEWKDLRTGKTLRQRIGLARVARYVPTRPASEFDAVARRKAAQAVAEGIVAVMRDEGDWDATQSPAADSRN